MRFLLPLLSVLLALLAISSAHSIKVDIDVSIDIDNPRHDTPSTHTSAPLALASALADTPTTSTHHHTTPLGHPGVATPAMISSLSKLERGIPGIMSHLQHPASSTSQTLSHYMKLLEEARTSVYSIMMKCSSPMGSCMNSHSRYFEMVRDFHGQMTITWKDPQYKQEEDRVAQYVDNGNKDNSMSSLSSAGAAVAPHPDIITAFKLHAVSMTPTSLVTPTVTTFNSQWNYNTINKRYNAGVLSTGEVLTPSGLFYPSTIALVQQGVLAAISSGTQIRIRCGGHSYEGVSSTGDINHFVIFDLSHLNHIDIDVLNKVGHVQGGATLGEVYYQISQKSLELAFAAGSCPTVGSGGHISGAGFGLLGRMYGLAADNVIGVLMVDWQGKLHDCREDSPLQIDRDLFWALRGGGGNSFGIVVQWNIRLVDVPKLVQTFYIAVNNRVDGLNWLKQWQTIAPYAPKELYMSGLIVGHGGGGEVSVHSSGQYLGTWDSLQQWLKQHAPTIAAAACASITNRTWIDAVLHFGSAPPHSPTSFLLNRNFVIQEKLYFKTKSDYVTTATNGMSDQGWNTIFDFVGNTKATYASLDPYGGAVWDRDASWSPFFHRKGTLFGIQYGFPFNPAAAPANPGSSEDEVIHDFPLVGGSQTAEPYAQAMAPVRAFHLRMAPFVSSNPRQHYYNYMDLDIGFARANGTATVEEGAAWGFRYWGKENYYRLVDIKTRIDPLNAFRNPQSIPVDVDKLRNGSPSTIIHTTPHGAAPSVTGSAHDAPLIQFYPNKQFPYTVTTSSSIDPSTPHLLHLEYHLLGDLSQLHIPATKSDPERLDNLSLDTCLEAFVSVTDQAFYWEFNFSPSGDWQAYAWGSYRKNSHPEANIKDIQVNFNQESSQKAVLSVDLDLSLLPLPSTLKPSQQWNLGLSSVLQSSATPPTHSYWALAHDGKRPDFHIRASFIENFPRN